MWDSLKADEKNVYNIKANPKDKKAKEAMGMPKKPLNGYFLWIGLHRDEVRKVRDGFMLD